MKKISILLFALVLFLIGCQGEFPLPIDLNTDELFVESIDLPSSTKEFLLEKHITFYKKLWNTVCIGFKNIDDSSSIAITDSDLNIIHTIDNLGTIYNVYEANTDQQIIIRYEISQRDKIDVFNLDTFNSFTMTPYLCGSSRFYNDLGNGEYLYVMENFISTSNVPKQLIKISEAGSTVIYEFNYASIDNVFVLPNQTYLVSYLQLDGFVETMIQIDQEGNELYREQISIYSIDLLRDGYLITTDIEDNQYRYINRDFNSETIWEVQTTMWLESPYEVGDHIAFDVYNESPIDEIEYDITGQIANITYYPDDESEYFDMQYELSSSKLLLIDSSSNGSYFKIVDGLELISSSTIDVLGIQVCVFEDNFYIYGYKLNSLRKLEARYAYHYDFDGNLIDQIVVTDAYIIGITSNHQIITYNYDVDKVQALSLTGEQLWDMDYQLHKPYFYEVSTELIVVGDMMEECYYFSPYQCPMNTMFVIDRLGNVVGNYQSEIRTYLVYQDNTYIYLFSSEDNLLKVYDYSFELKDEFQIILHTKSYTYYGIKQNKLYIFHFPETLRPIPSYPDY